MKLLIAFAILSCLATAYGLSCYNCFYAKGLGGDEKCLKKPKDAPKFNCPTRSSSTLPDLVQYAAYNSSTPGLKANKLMCGKGYGKMMFNGKTYDAVIRGCANATEADDKKCDLKSYRWELQLNSTTKIEITNLPTCVCSKDNCNGAGSLSLASGFGFLVLAAGFKQFLALF